MIIKEVQPFTSLRKTVIIVLLRYISLLREKEHRSLQMGDELSKLIAIEKDNARKNNLIEELRNKLENMEKDVNENVSKTV